LKGRDTVTRFGALIEAGKVRKVAFVVAGVLTLGLAGALSSPSAEANHPFPNCGDGEIPVYLHIPTGNSQTDVSLCVPVAEPTVRAGTPSPGRFFFTTPEATAVIATSTAVATQAATATQPPPATATPVPPPSTGTGSIRPPNTGDAGLR
jgi:hypothetical protein